MKHMIIYVILIPIIIAFIGYKGYEKVINSAIPVEEEKHNHQLDIFKLKRAIMRK